jgi:hypothetical protein
LRNETSCWYNLLESLSWVPPGDNQLMGFGKHMEYEGYVKKVFPPWLEQLTSVINSSIQPASKAARRGLVNLILLNIPEIRRY